MNPGDRAVIIGPTPADPKAWTATAVLVMSKSDVAALQQKDQDDWKKRGTTGTVTAIDAAAKTVTIKSGSRTFTVQPSDKTSFHRYSLDSARFSDAKPSTFAEIKTGDQLRVLGNKSEDGTVIQAEKIVSGTFRQIAATITAINPQTGELTVKDLATKKPLTIKIDADSTMRKLPEQAARMLARRYAPGAARPRRGARAAGGMRRGGRAAATSARCWITCRPCRFPNSNPVTPSWFPPPRARTPGGSPQSFACRGRTPADGLPHRHPRHHERLEPGRRRRHRAVMN